MNAAQFVFAVAGLFAATSAHAFSAQDLMQLLSEVPSSRVSFVETRESTLLKKPLALRGELVYRRPDRLEKHVQAPFVETITIEGSRVTVARPADVDRVLALPAGGAAQALIESLRATLAGDLPALERHFAVAVSGTRSAWTMQLIPRVPSLPVTRVDFAGSEHRIQRIEVIEAGGDRTVTTIGDEAR